MDRRNLFRILLGLTGVQTLVSSVQAKSCPASAEGHRFEICTDKNDQFRWRLWAANNKIIAHGEAYPDRRDCEHAISLVKQSYDARVEKEILPCKEEN